MKNLLFSDQELEVLNNTRNWNFISSAFPSEAKPVQRSGHGAWAQKHLHTHAHPEFLFILSGTGYQYHSGKIYPARPGTILMFGPMEPHEVGYPLDHSMAKHMWCCFFYDQCHINLVLVNGRLSVRHYRYIEDQIYDLARMGLASSQALFPVADSGIPAQWGRQRAVGALELLIARLVEEGYRSQEALDEPDFREHLRPKHLIRAMVRHIHRQEARNCSLETLAEMTGYSKYHFSRMFKTHAGISFRECVNDVRARVFQRLLAHGLSMKNIATELGFSHVSGLHRWRRKMKV